MLFTGRLSVVMLNVVMPSVVMLNVVIPSVVMLNVVMLSVVMLSVVALNVMVPYDQLLYFNRQIFLYCTFWRKRVWRENP